MRQDLRDSVRHLRRHPGFAAVTVLTLSLGLAANAAFFSLVNAALLRPLPVQDPDRLANVYMTRRDGTGYGALSYLDYRDLTAAAAVFHGVAGYRGFPGTIAGDSRAESIFGEMVTGNFFQVLGVTPVLGRGFVPEEDRVPDAHPVAVLGYGLVGTSLAACIAPARRAARLDPSVSLRAE